MRGPMIDSEILDFYGNGTEEQRLARSLGRLERIRTWEIMDRRLDSWLDDDSAREYLLRVLRRLESEPSLIGASPHLIAVSRK